MGLDLIPYGFLNFLYIKPLFYFILKPFFT